MLVSSLGRVPFHFLINKYIFKTSYEKLNLSFQSVSDTPGHVMYAGNTDIIDYYTK